MAAFDVLRRYLSERAVFTEDDFAFMETVFLPRALKTDEFLQRAGDVSRYASFIATGCLRSAVVDSTGEAHTVRLASAASWLVDSTSLGAGTPSRYSYQAVEDSELLLIDPMSHQMLVHRIPSYASSFQAGLEKDAASEE